MPILRAALLLPLAASLSPAGAQDRAPDVDYAPTPNYIVREMLELADVTPRDVVYDLGSGDGRIVIMAAKEFGARGVGIEIDQRLIRRSRENARKAGVEDRVEFRQQDLFKADFRDATVVATYLLSYLNARLVPKLKRLRRGTRIVAHSFDMGDAWPPDKQVAVFGSTVFLWTVK